MKANAPEKIYVDADENWHRSHSVFKEKAKENDIEYVRIDAFIEKVCEWLRNNSYTYANNALGKEYLVNDFKNYMEGE